jgi:hypothetical protein
VVHACNHSTQEAEAGGSWVWDQPGLYSELQASLSYVVGPCFNTPPKKIQNIKLTRIWRHICWGRNLLSPFPGWEVRAVWFYQTSTCPMSVSYRRASSASSLILTDW